MNKFIVLSLCVFLVACGGSQTNKKDEQTTNTMDADVIALVIPQETGASLLDAYKKRASVREYADNGLTLNQLSGVLWAAAGQNRPDGKLTVPSALGAYPINVYVVIPNGIYLYNSVEHNLTLVKKGDYRSKAGLQDFVYTAPLNLMYVADLRKFDELSAGIPMEERLVMSCLDAGHYSQSVALWCAGNGMGSVPRGWTNEEEFLKVIDAPDSYRIPLAQTIGILK